MTDTARVLLTAAVLSGVTMATFAWRVMRTDPSHPDRLVGELRLAQWAAVLLTAIGAIPIGYETSADTFYLEVRNIDLPAGVGSVTVPMKVYAGRPRGSNQSVVPKHRFSGDIADTAALERWIATLPERTAPQP